MCRADEDKPGADDLGGADTQQPDQEGAGAKLRLHAGAGGRWVAGHGAHRRSEIEQMNRHKSNWIMNASVAIASLPVRPCSQYQNKHHVTAVYWQWPVP